ncbi:hypothetical protein [Desulfobacula sp.]
MIHLAKDSGLGRTSLYKALSPGVKRSKKGQIYFFKFGGHT